MRGDNELIKGEYVKFRLQLMQNGVDVVMINKAWDFAVLAHHGQRRKTGEPFVMHALEVGKKLFEWNLDTQTIVAGILHDTVEDGGALRQDLAEGFGDPVAVLVDGVTKISNIKLRGSKNEEFIENLRKMFLAMAKDLRVVLVKLADRLHNMKTLHGVEEGKRKRIAEETLEIYAPLAERLGMGQVKAELDDLAFPYVYPEEHEKVVSLSKPYYKNTEKDVDTMKRKLLKVLAASGLKSKVSGRKKHLYSLWKKLERPDIAWDFERIHDIIALRVLVETAQDCYKVLGIIHGLYKPVPYIGISDFIAQPKPNGYRSIHTKVFGVGARIIEIQIRTWTMHEQAENGIAAHWAYAGMKLKKGITNDLLDKRPFDKSFTKLSWVKQLADWQKEIKDSSEYMEAVRFDALSSRIFVFSPMGDVYDLPIGATPIDFAYSVHTNLSGFVKSVKVNGKIASLNQQLSSGDVIEIIKNKNYKSPPRDWLDFVKTTQAKREIEKSLRKVGA
ncbi:MAG: (P)ppGpp synthetase I, SpoT/RelA [Candidatus Woesebacteria bacterium GW2011_GWA1_39_21]|uniref:(P)ppGpp synthetase I, SpoT/RelA n=1 Tax=Candidatus Woesebacteria bacterium GW2011_GWA1_39_21 TaxID=1618550 RepID=A0A0G0N6G3_9BACT|nr:MAG: (P)ppGpp synthetase I, SpoT/RelA [Candidatus Woesebacteria bacterium GW2011_GWA1_39_21]